MTTRAKAKNGNKPFRGFCLHAPKQADLDLFKRLITEVLPAHRCNALVLLIRYRYEFQSHPEIRGPDPLTKPQAAEIARLCRENGIRIIPKMNLMGHQSGKKRGSEDGLLKAHPEFDETPDQAEVEYCRSLCPRHPEIKNILFDLIDELIDAFETDAIHVGLDEVFEIGLCPRCKDTPTADLFTEWVNALHGHIVGKRNVEMLMWGDRLLDDAETGYERWQSSANGTAAAIDRIPKDIVICDWHYEVRDDYPSIDIFSEKGFRFLICPWKDSDAAKAFIRFAQEKKKENLLGVLATSWCDSGPVARYLCESNAEVPETAGLVGEAFKKSMELMS